MTTQEQTIPTRILVIVAHPDDIEFGCAGSIARWVREGSAVTYCIVTDGSAGSNDPNVQRDDLIRRRKEEQLVAAQHVGVNDVRFLGYQDSMLQPTLELRKELTRLIRELRPERVVCQDPTTFFVRGSYINHPDHRAAGEAAIYAVFPSAETRPSFPELLAEGYEPHHVSELYLTLTLAPDTIIDISETIEQKIAALLAHASQVGPEAEQWIREWNSELGKEHGYGYAEAFKVMKLERD
jgi:LmbE family N-acetylglucosaminyl deacetylase